jgi:hypothetical protein
MKSLKDHAKRRGDALFPQACAREAENAMKTLANKALEHKASRHKNFGA